MGLAGGEYFRLHIKYINFISNEVCYRFGYLDFQEIESATKAIQMFDRQPFEGRTITVQYARTRDPADQSEPLQPHRPKNPPSQTLFIGNMAYDMSDKDLNNLFSRVKNVTDVRVAIDRRTGQPRGFAHADFVDTESAVAAMKYLQQIEVCGRTLRLDYSISKPRARVSDHIGENESRH